MLRIAIVIAGDSNSSFFDLLTGSLDTTPGFNKHPIEPSVRFDLSRTGVASIEVGFERSLPNCAQRAIEVIGRGGNRRDVDTNGSCNSSSLSLFQEVSF